MNQIIAPTAFVMDETYRDMCKTLLDGFCGTCWAGGARPKGKEPCAKLETAKRENYDTPFVRQAIMDALAAIRLMGGIEFSEFVELVTEAHRIECKDDHTGKRPKEEWPELCERMDPFVAGYTWISPEHQAKIEEIARMMFINYDEMIPQTPTG